jgi:SAM-dependent methyltransferase
VNFATKYHTRLLEGGSFLTRFAHRSRSSNFLSLLKGRSFESAVDWGCGDAWTLQLLLDAKKIIHGVGVDNDYQKLQNCRTAFQSENRLTFAHPVEIERGRKYDLVICAETIEHVVNPNEVLKQIASVCHPQSTVLISAPIELGPALIIKQIGRYIAARFNGPYGYERYTLQELIQASLFWNTATLNCSHNSGSAERGHKGFDFRKTECFIKKQFKIHRKTFGPLPWTRTLFNATIYWICRLP